MFIIVARGLHTIKNYSIPDKVQMCYRAVTDSWLQIKSDLLPHGLPTDQEFRSVTRMLRVNYGLWIFRCVESASALSDYYYYYKEKERKVNFRTRFFLMLANEFLAFEHSPLFFVDIIIHCSLLRTCRVRVEEKEEFLVYTVLWTLTCHPYLESATALSDKEKEQKSILDIDFFLC